MDKILGMLVILILSSCSVASDNPITIPKNDKQRLITANLSFTTKSFFDAYMSSNVEQRRLAEMYLIGVIDSSEGELWCGFGVASPDAIQEQAYNGLKHTLEISPKERAARAIISKLKELLPCKEDK